MSFSQVSHNIFEAQVVTFFKLDVTSLHDLGSCASSSVPRLVLLFMYVLHCLDVHVHIFRLTILKTSGTHGRLQMIVVTQPPLPLAWMKPSTAQFVKPFMWNHTPMALRYVAHCTFSEKKLPTTLKQ